MQGLASLTQAPQGQQQQMPGQAPMQPMTAMMPGMMAGQGSSTPAAEVGRYEGLELPQLIALFQQQPSGVLLGKITAAVEAAKIKQAQADQAAMVQAAQQDAATVKDDVLAQAMQLAGPQEEEPVMAAHGGMMHGYAGGGAVAFDEGGDIRVKRILQKSPFERTAEENEILRAAGVELTRRTIPEGGISALNKMLEGPFFRRIFTGEAYKLSPEELAKRTDAGAITERLFRTLGGQQFAESPASPAETKSASTQTEAPSARQDIPRFTSQELERFVKTPTPAPAPAPAAPEPQKRQVATALKPGISGLVGPEIDPYTRAASEYQKALEQGTKLTPEQIAARQKIDEAMTGRKKFIGTEEQRRESLSEKRLQEALERSRVSPLEDITFIGQMLEGMKGTKRFGEGLAGLASGAGKAQAGREAALRAAEEKYDLSRNEIFKLQDARNQLDMDEAKLAEARATGDADKINAAAANVARSKMELAKLQADMEDRALGRRLEREKIDVERAKVVAATEGTKTARDAATQQRLMGMIAGAEAKKQELVRKITEDFKDANKQAYLMTSIPGAKVTPEMIAQRQDLDRQLALKIRSATSDLDKIIAQTASQIPGMGSLYGTSGGGVPAGVTVEKVQ